MEKKASRRNSNPNNGVTLVTQIPPQTAFCALFVLDVHAITVEPRFPEGRRAEEIGDRSLLRVPSCVLPTKWLTIELRRIAPQFRAHGILVNLDRLLEDERAASRRFNAAPASPSGLCPEPSALPERIQ